MRRALCFAVAVASQLLVGCWGLAIDVGTTHVQPEAAVEAEAGVEASFSDGSDADAGTPSIAQECMASGQVDRFFTAKEVTARLVGRWGQCPGVTASPLPCPPQTKLWGIRFSADGTFALLGAQSEFSDYVDQPDACGRGLFKIYAPTAASEGGAGQYVPLDDTALRNGLEVHLFPESGAVDVELPEFEHDPRRMYLREQGQVDSRGYFAPIPPRVR